MALDDSIAVPDRGSDAFQNANEGKLVPLADAYDPEGDAVDPDSTGNALQELADDIKDAGPGEGAILPPPGPVSLDSSFIARSGISIVNPYGTEFLTQFEFPAGTDGFVFDDTQVPENGVSNIKYAGFGIVGAGDDAAAADTMKIKGSTTVSRWTMDRVEAREWYGHAFTVESDTNTSFDNEWGFVGARNVDAGDVSAMFQFHGGPDWQVDRLVANATATTSASNSVALDMGNTTDVKVGDFIPQGSVGRALFVDRCIVPRVELMHYEANSQQSTPNELIAMNRDRPLHVGAVEFGAGSATYVYSFQGGEYNVPRPKSGTGATNVVEMAGQPGKTGTYRGPVSEEDNTVGADLNEPMLSTWDLTLKKSQGTGYDGGAVDKQL